MDGKLMPGLQGDLVVQRFILGFEGGVIDLTNSVQVESEEHSFLGNNLGVHLGGRAMVWPLLELRIATGLDAFLLWNLSGDDYRLAVPLLAEVRVFPWKWLSGFVQARYYPLHSKGMEPGVNRAREEGIPLVLAFGLEGWL